MWPFTKKGNYAYACTRVKAKKSFLLSKDVYSRMLVMDLYEVARSLGETQYSQEMAKYASKYSGANLIEVAVTQNLAHTLSEVYGFTTGHLKEMVGDYLKRWDTINVKTILRGKVTHVKEDEIIDTLIPAGRFSEEYLRSLVMMETVQEIMDSLAKQPSMNLTPELIREVVDTGRLASLEDHLDKMFYYDLLKTLSDTSSAEQMFRRFARHEIDITNLKTLIKLKAEKLPEDKIQKYLIPGGVDFSMERLRALAQADGMGSIMDEIEKTLADSHLKIGMDAYRESGKLSDITIALDKALIGTSEKFAHFYPLSVLPIVNYMVLKRNEIINIRVIARGKQSGLSNEVIQGLLVT